MRFPIFQKAEKLVTDLFKYIARPNYVVILVAVAAIWVNFNNSIWNKPNGVVHNDVISYYSYLPAFIIYKDMSFSYVDDNPEFFHGKFYNYFTEDGSRYQKMTMGLAVMYSPFFLLAHLYAYLSGAPMDGYSTPYMFFLVFSALFYLLAAMLLLKYLLRRYFSEKVTALVLLVVVMGTNLFYYSTLQAAMSHVYNFFLFTVFIWLSIRWHETPKWHNTILLGLTFGLISLIRPTNAIIILFFLLFNIHSIESLKSKIALIAQHPVQVILFTLAAFMVVLPQLLFWKSNTGQWLYYSYSDEGFFFNNPQIFSGLFSYRKGWLVYTPVMAFALAGMFFLPKWRKSMFLPILVFTLVNIYVIYSWWSWWYGGSFGSRPMIESYAMLAFPLAAFVRHFDGRRLAKKMVYSILLGLTALNLFQTMQYKYGIIHHDEMSKSAYWHIFGKVSGDLWLYDKLEPLDIELAMKGIYQTVPKMKPSIRQSAFTSFERLTAESSHFVSEDGHFHFRRGGYQHIGFARTGAASLRMDSLTAFASTIEFQVNPNESYMLSVWKYPADSRAALVFASVTANEYYIAQEIPSSTDENGWGLLTFKATVPNEIEGKYRVYIWNKANQEVYIDDLLIEKLQNE